MSPERISGLQYIWNSDIWSLGISLVEIATGCFPYQQPGPLAPPLPRPPQGGAEERSVLEWKRRVWKRQGGKRRGEREEERRKKAKRRRATRTISIDVNYRTISIRRYLSDDFYRTISIGQYLSDNIDRTISIRQYLSDNIYGARSLSGQQLELVDLLDRIVDNEPPTLPDTFAAGTARLLSPFSSPPPFSRSPSLLYTCIHIYV